MTGGEADGVRTFAAERRADVVAARKCGQRVSMCIPCHDEAATVGPIVERARRELVDRSDLVDELIVLDDRSTDETARVAADAGATVVPIDRIHQRFGDGAGKGNALWTSLAASSGDVVVWCDGDVTSFEPSWVVGLVAPLLDDEGLALVKASYHRPTSHGGGGRTTELVARPLLSMFAPGLAAIDQPLAGEFAGRRTALERIPFACGWGAEIAMILDLAAEHGPSAIGQVDLGERHHRHHELRTLSVQAAEVMATALARLGHAPSGEHLVRADGSVVALNLTERPPLAGRRARRMEPAGDQPTAPSD